MVAGEGKNPTKEHLLALAKKHRLKNGVSICDEVYGSVAQWSKFGQRAGVSQKMIRFIESKLLS